METFILNIYQKLGDYFTGSKRRRLLYALVVIFFVSILVISTCFKLSVSIDTLYWVFSSLVQALLALVALMGVVSVFKLQSLKSSEDQFLMIARESTYTYYIGAPPSTIELLLSKIEPVISSNNLDKSNHLHILRDNIMEVRSSKELVVNYATKYAIFTFLVVLLSLLFLMCTTYISRFYLGVPSLYLMFVLTAYSLFLAMKGFSGSIR